MEKVIHALSAISGAVIGFMFGELTGLIIALVFFMTVDYLNVLKEKYEENTKIKMIYLHLFSFSYFSNAGKSTAY